MNNVCIIGNITRDPELRYTPSGKAVTTLNVAINEGYGENKKAHFLNCVVWEKSAENCTKYLGKGSKVGISGKLTQRSWENQEGKRQSVVEVMAFNVEFLSAPKERPLAEPQATDIIPENGIEEEIFIPGEEETF